MAMLKFLVLAAIPISIGIYLAVFGSNDSTVPEMNDRWWGKTSQSQTKEDLTINPFVINVSPDVLEDLHHRLKNARLPMSLENTQFEYGFHSDYLKFVLEYWRTKYDWSQYQAKLNAFPQFKTKIDGIEVHFLHIKPSSSVGKKRPLLLIHGWPGSVWEFYKMIPLLTEPNVEVKEDKELIAFEIICPSIPGYGFSEAPHRPGFDVSAAAHVFYKLMLRLGHEKFYVQGGDWGSIIATIMSKAYPSNVIGVHVNMPTFRFDSSSAFVRLLIGEFFPGLVCTQEEIKLKVPFKIQFFEILKESGYMHLQSTKPDTVAVGLNDSPAGLAAYILEKFSTWTNNSYRSCSDGCITKHFTLDEVLTNVMIYWISGSIGSSVRFYKESFTNPQFQQWDKFPVTIPSGVAVFPNEIIFPLRSVVSLTYQNIVRYTHMPHGGHFAAFEEPELLAKDIISFVKAVEEL